MGSIYKKKGKKIMQQINIDENEAGQRLDKFFHKFMPLAASSFFYKMLRKKNITLNGKKAEGKEKLVKGDVVCLYLSDDTILHFRKDSVETAEYDEAYKTLKGIEVVYEDKNVMVVNKPAGILSQKAAAEDKSVNEWLIGYLLKTGAINEMQLSTYKPSVCNRLDRNTFGLVIGAKSLAGSQKISSLLKNREIRKFYRMFVKGRVVQEELLEGRLVKDEENNKSYLVKGNDGQDGSLIKTRYYPISHFLDRTLVEAELITGKPHQLRIHMASIGHPVLGDYKYGDRSWNDRYKREYQIKSQLLCACRLEFPKLEGDFAPLSQKVIEISLPKEFRMLEHV